MSVPWDPLPEESAAAYEAFTKYYLMSPSERSIAKVAAARGVASPTTDEGWSVRWNWVDRARAYDTYMAKALTTAVLATKTEAQREHLKNVTMGFTIAQQVATAALMQMQENLSKPEDKDHPENGHLDTKSFNRIVRSLVDIDTGMRRALQLPTQFKTETVTDEDMGDEEVYFIRVGGDRREDDE